MVTAAIQMGSLDGSSLTIALPRDTEELRFSEWEIEAKEEDHLLVRSK